MSMFTPIKALAKPKKQQKNWENTSEIVREFSNEFARTAQQESKNFIGDAFRQITALEQDIKNLSGELTAGGSIDIAQIEQAQQAKHPASRLGGPTIPDEFSEIKAYQQPGIDYHREFSAIKEVRVVKEDTRQIQIRVDQILFELRNLANSSEELAVQFENVTMEEAPVDAGRYHLNFFEWVFAVIRKARERIEESQTWLAMFKNKKGQKTYWNMFKKHGTMFGLSGERVVATQTG